MTTIDNYHCLPSVSVHMTLPSWEKLKLRYLGEARPTRRCREKCFGLATTITDSLVRLYFQKRRAAIWAAASSHRCPLLSSPLEDAPGPPQTSTNSLLVESYVFLAYLAQD